jgi:site-specific recombinase XerD
MHLADSVGARTVQEVQRAQIHDYFATLDRRGQAGATRAQRLAAVKSFFSHVADCGLVAHNLARGILRPKQEAREPRVLTEEEYRRVRHTSKDHPRDKAIVELFLQTGLRLSEVAGLAVADLELPSNTGDGGIGAVRVMGKGRKRRTVTLNWKAAQALQAYLNGRCSSDSFCVFCSRTGKALGARAIQRIVQKYMSKAGIEGARVHALRHTFATHMVRKGTNLRVIQEALGHTSLQTTSVYISLARDLTD